MSRRALALRLALVLAAFALRALGTHGPLRGDEAITVEYWVRQPLTTTLAHNRVQDPQPPLAYTLLHAWGRVFGEHEVALRALAVLTGTLTVPLMFALARSLGLGARPATVAAALVVSHPLLVWHAQDFRNYAPWAAASLLALTLGVRALRASTWRGWLWYGFAATAALYLYYLEAFVVLAFVLAAGWVAASRQAWGRGALTLVVVGVAAGAWYVPLAFSDAPSAYGGTTVGFAPSVLFTQFPVALALGYAVPATPWLAATMMLVTATGLVVMARHNRRAAALVGALLFVPPLLLALAATRLNVFAPRYITPTTFAFILAAAALTPSSFTRTRRLRAWWGVFPLGVYTLLSVAGLAAHTRAPKSPDWPSVVGHLAANTTPATPIVQAAADPAFLYYARRAALPSPLITLPEHPHQPEDDVRARLGGLLMNAPDGVWVVGAPPANWPNAVPFAQALNAQAQTLRAAAIDGVPVRLMRAWAAPLAAGSAALASFDGVAVLVDVALHAEPTGDLTLWLDWQAIAPAAPTLSVFAHLVGPLDADTDPSSLPPSAQHDAPLAQQLPPVTAWQPGGVWRHVALLPFANRLPPGHYVLRVGLYDPASGARTLITNGADAFTAPLTLPLAP